VVDANFTELIDDDGGVFHLNMANEMIEQGGFAAA
jgi:hypothetical protein